MPVPAFQSEPLLQPEYQIPQGVEANASSGAIALRKGLNPAVAADRRKLAELSDDDPVWDATAHYLAGLCVNLILIASPEKIGALRSRQSTIAGILCMCTMMCAMDERDVADAHSLLMSASPSIWRWGYEARVPAPKDPVRVRLRIHWL